MATLLVRVLLAACFLPLVLATASDSQRIAFAMPTDGLVTLGVFDQAGRLVRALHELAPEGAFQVGLNGYITQWDGRDDAGKKVTPGHYHIRGYVVGAVTVEGEDVLFNDWIHGDAAPSITRILDFAFLGTGNVILLGTDGASPPRYVLGRYDPDGGFLWSKILSIPRPTFAANNDIIALGSPEKIELIETETGTLRRNIEGQLQIRALALSEDSIFLGTDESVFTRTSEGNGSWAAIKAPAGVTVLDASGPRLAALNSEGLWLRAGEGDFSMIPLATRPSAVSLGADETLWFVGLEPGLEGTVVGQANVAGTILRVLRSEPGSPSPVLLRASRSADAFAVLEEERGLQCLRVMRRDAATGAWNIEWERSIINSERFGFSDEKPTPDVGDSVPSTEIKFRLEKNPLTGEEHILRAKAIYGGEGTRLVTEDGLLLVRVSDRADIRRVAIRRAATSDTIHWLQGEGAAVEEFTIRGLRHILPIDAGGVDVRD